MLANEGSGTSSTRGPPPITSKASFSFSTWLMLFAAFLMKFPLVFEAYKVEVPKRETEDEKLARIAKYGENSQKAYSYLVEACSSSAVAIQIVINHAATDPSCWANTLMKRLTARFTIQASTRLQNLIGEFNLLTVAPEETGAMFMDRYNAKVAAISAIDLLQLPSKIARLNVLKTAIKSAFPILFALMMMKEAEVKNIEALEDKFAQLITEWNQENALGVKAQQESAAVAQFTQLSESFTKKTGALKKAFTRKQNSGRGEERPVRRCFRCDSEDHIFVNCPEASAEKKKDSRERNRDERDDSAFEKKRNKKDTFPLKSGMKKRDKKKERRSTFFDSNGDGEDNSDGSSVMMIYHCDFVPESFNAGDYENVEDVEWDVETAFVFVTMKMEAAFNAMFFSMLNWICIDSACNVNLMNFLPEGITDYLPVTQGFGISTAGKDGHLTIVATFTWGNTVGIKYCPNSRASLFATSFFMDKKCEVLFTGLSGTNECKILCRTGTDTEDPMAVPRRVELAAAHGGLFWISPQFQLDLVMRNGLTQEMEENLLREVDQVYEEANIYVNQQVANAACEMISAVEQAAEEDEYFAVPWENHPAGDNGGHWVKCV